MSYAHQHHIPVTPREPAAACLGLPVKGGIVVDTKRLNRILEIDRANMTARWRRVVLQNFHRAVEERGLFPPDPQSMVSVLSRQCSYQAGGPRGVKYGTTGNYVTGLEVVPPMVQ